MYKNIDRKLTPVERLMLDNQHIILYALRNMNSDNMVVFDTVQAQMVRTRNVLDQDDLRERTT